jgi:hypothetical protein
VGQHPLACSGEAGTQALSGPDGECRQVTGLVEHVAECTVGGAVKTCQLTVRLGFASPRRIWVCPHAGASAQITAEHRGARS